MSDRLVNVYRLKNQFLVHASSRTRDGLWVLTPPCLLVSTDAGDEALGRTVISGLDRSRDGVGRPDNWKALLAPLLKAARVRGWRAFAQGATHAVVEERNGRLKVEPSRLDKDHSFIPEPDRAVSMEGRDPRQLGEALRTVLGVPQ